jgi:hypothetical protein
MVWAWFYRGTQRSRFSYICCWPVEGSRTSLRNSGFNILKRWAKSELMDPKILYAMSFIFWDITQCSPLCLYCLLPASRWLLAWLILRPWRWRRHVTPKCQLAFNGLYDDIPEKIEPRILQYFTPSNSLKLNNVMCSFFKEMNYCRRCRHIWLLPR